MAAKSVVKGRRLGTIMPAGFHGFAGTRGCAKQLRNPQQKVFTPKKETKSHTTPPTYSSDLRYNDRRPARNRRRDQAGSILLAEIARAEITRILTQLRNGDDRAAERLLPLVYDRLRDIARNQFRHERRNHTLQPTALVHQAYLEMVEHDAVDFQARTHFFATAAKIMRQLLVDHARSKMRQKREGSRRRIPLHDDVLTLERDEDVLRVEEALEKLAAVDARQATIVELRFFGGLTVEEVAQVLKVSKRTIEAEWTMIRAWLRKELAGDEP